MSSNRSPDLFWFILKALVELSFLLRKSGLLFNAEVPAVIIEEDRVAIVKIRDPDQIKVGDRARHCAKLVQKSQSRIHPDHLLLINNVLHYSSSPAVAISTLASLDEIEDFGIDHWQYIGAKMEY